MTISEERGSAQPTSAVRRAFAEVRGRRRWIVVLFILELLATPLALLTPVPLALAVDSALGDRPLPGPFVAVLPQSMEGSTSGILLAACILQIAIVVLTQLRSLVASYIQTWVGEMITLDVRSRALAHAQTLSFRFHDQKGTADSIYKIQYDAPAIQQISVSGVLPLLTSSITLVSMIVVIMRLDVQLALVALATTPVLFAATRRYRTRVKPRYREVKKLESRNLKNVQEVLSAFRVVKAFGREEEEEQRFTTQSETTAQARLSVTLAEGVFGVLVGVVTALSGAAVLYVGGLKVDDGSLTLGALLLVLSYLTQLFGPLQTISRRIASVQAQIVSAERIMELLDEVPEVRDRPDARHLDRCSGAFELRNVTFGYDADQPILCDVTLDVPAGATVGIVGRTGAGKSTIVSLLARFYDVTSGSILLDELDVRDYKLKDLRQQFAIVLQDPFLFSTSIVENISYARPDASREDIVAAAQAAGVHDFVSSLPEGYDTLVGERGMRLSGGERQRLSLARAFLRDAPVLVLDEPTSSVDTSTEAEIMVAMRRLMVGRTTFMIAHRLSTLDVCDMIIEVDGGTATVMGAAPSGTGVPPTAKAAPAQPGAPSRVAESSVATGCGVSD